MSNKPILFVQIPFQRKTKASVFLLKVELISRMILLTCQQLSFAHDMKKFSIKISKSI